MNNPVVVERELLPCPFCGSEARLDQRVTQSLWNSGDAVFSHVTCDECDISGQDFCDDPDGEEAIDWWNRRAQPAEAEGVSALDELLALYPFKIDKQAFVVNGGAPLTADGDDEFLSFKKVDAALDQIRQLAEHARAALSAVTVRRHLAISCRQGLQGVSIV